MRRTVVLDLVHPQRAGRWLRHLRRKHGAMKAGGTPHDHGRRIGQQWFNRAEFGLSIAFAVLASRLLRFFRLA
jgi:hypothetical protein